MGIYQQSAYALQSAYILESTTNMLNFVNFTASCFDKNETVSLEQIGSWEDAATQNITKETTFNALGCASYTTLENAKIDFKNKQIALSKLYAARFNALYKNAMQYIISDSPMPTQKYTAPTDNQKPQSEITVTLSNEMLSNPINNSNGGQRVPINYVRSNLQGVFYQYQNINNIYGCIDKQMFGYDYNSSESNVSAKTCSSAFPDTNESFYDGKSLQVYVPENSGSFVLSNRLDMGFCSVSQPMLEGVIYTTDTDDTYIYNNNTLWCRKPFGPKLTSLLTKSSNWAPAFSNYVCYGIELNSDDKSTDLFPDTDSCPAGGTSGLQCYNDKEYGGSCNADIYAYKKVWLNQDPKYQGVLKNYYSTLYASNSNDGTLELATPKNSSNPTEGNYRVGFFQFASEEGIWNIVSDPYETSSDDSSETNDFQHTALVSITLEDGYIMPFYLVDYQVAKSKKSHSYDTTNMSAMCPNINGSSLPGLTSCEAMGVVSNGGYLTPYGVYGFLFTTESGTYKLSNDVDVTWSIEVDSYDREFINTNTGSYPMGLGLEVYSW